MKRKDLQQVTAGKTAFISTQTMIKKQLRYGDITRIAEEFDCSATYVQQALSGNCETKLCRSIRDYAKYIISQYDARTEELKRIIALQRRS